MPMMGIPGVAYEVKLSLISYEAYVGSGSNDFRKCENLSPKNFEIIYLRNHSPGWVTKLFTEPMELQLQIFSYKSDHLISAIFAVVVSDRKGYIFLQGTITPTFLSFYNTKIVI